jgi:hypothetical protein
VHNSEKPFMLAANDVPELQLVICHMAWLGSCQHQAFSGAYGTTIAYINPRFYSQLFELLGRPRDKQSPSTGLLAIAIALGTCERVTLYGFGAGGGGANKRCRHYWECSDGLLIATDWLSDCLPHQVPALLGVHGLGGREQVLRPAAHVP